MLACFRLWNAKRKEKGELKLQGARGSVAVPTTPTHSQISHPLDIYIQHQGRKGGRIWARSICTSQSFYRALHPAEMSCGMKPATSRRNGPPWPLSKSRCLQAFQDTAGIRRRGKDSICYQTISMVRQIERWGLLSFSQRHNSILRCQRHTHKPNPQLLHF